MPSGKTWGELHAQRRKAAEKVGRVVKSSVDTQTKVKQAQDKYLSGTSARRHSASSDKAEAARTKAGLAKAKADAIKNKKNTGK